MKNQHDYTQTEARIVLNYYDLKRVQKLKAKIELYTKNPEKQPYSGFVSYLKLELDQLLNK